MTEQEPEQELFIKHATGYIEVSQELLGDCADMSDLIGKALRGEIEFKEPEPPKCHRCFICWLVSKLPGHYRCSHGYLVCEQCELEASGW